MGDYEIDKDIITVKTLMIPDNLETTQNFIRFSDGHTKWITTLVDCKVITDEDPAVDVDMREFPFGMWLVHLRIVPPKDTRKTTTIVERRY